jgi:hypothetical protein
VGDDEHFVVVVVVAQKARKSPDFDESPEAGADAGYFHLPAAGAAGHVWPGKAKVKCKEAVEEELHSQSYRCRIRFGNIAGVAVVVAVVVAARIVAATVAAGESSEGAAAMTA